MHVKVTFKTEFKIESKRKKIDCQCFQMSNIVSKHHKIPISLIDLNKLTDNNKK